MADSLRDLVVSLSLNTDNFTRNINSVNKQIKEAESYFKLASAGVNNYESTTAGLTGKLDTLQQKLKFQKEVVEQYERALAAASEKLREYYDRQTDYAARLDEARQKQADAAQSLAAHTEAYEALRDAYGETDAQTQAAKEDMEAVRTEYDAATISVEKLAGQNDALQRATQNAADAVSTAQTQLNGASAKVRETEAAIIETNQALALSQTSWQSAQERIAEADKAITSIGRSMKLAESEFNLATAGMKDVDTSAEGLAAKTDLLSDKITLQQEAVEQYEEKLKAAQEALEAAQDAEDPDKIDEATEAVTEAQTELNNARAELINLEVELEDTHNNLRIAQSSWQQAGQALMEFGERCRQVGESAERVGRAMTNMVSKRVYAFAKEAVSAAMEFEQSFALVRKTVNGTEADFSELAEAAKRMSTEVAMSTSDITKVMATAGQLGIQTEYIEDFARAMIDLQMASTDLDADTAATQLAKFANIMGTDQSLFSNIGSTIAMLGNNFATTEAPIAEMAMRIAGAGKQVGLTEAQVLGLATALSSVGIQAQAGGSSISKMLINMEVAATSSSKKAVESLSGFAQVLGMTTDEFKEAWGKDAVGVFLQFITNLAGMSDEGISAIAVLDELGISEIRLRDTMLRATNATELFVEAQAMAETAWEENTALSEKAGVRYGTVQNQLVNLQNKLTLFKQTLGDDLMPVVQKLMDMGNKAVDWLNGLDESSRQLLLRVAGIVAAIGPALLIFGKLAKAVGTVSTALGAFAIKVAAAGGGFSGFLSTLAASPAVWVALTVAVVAGTIALLDWATGAKAAREALKGMSDAAKEWRETAAETFYSTGEGLSFFGMSTSDFQKNAESTTQSAEQWKEQLLAVWSDGEKETDEIVKQWIESWTELSGSTREGLQGLRETANERGYTSLTKQMDADLASLDAADKEIEALLRQRQNGFFSEADEARLAELVSQRNEIELKYRLVPDESDNAGFDTVRERYEAELRRAEARNQPVSMSVYENTALAAAQGLAAVNSELDAQYDSEHALIELIEDKAEREAAEAALNERYNAERKAAAQEYAELMREVYSPIMQKESIQNTRGQIDALSGLLGMYSTLDKSERGSSQVLQEMNSIVQGMDESALTEYVGMLLQIQTMLDSGMSEEEIAEIFPEFPDVSNALDQLAALQQYLNENSWDTNLSSLREMLGGSLGEEVLKITTDLDMTGAQARWEEWASNPGAITTDAVIQSYTESPEATYPVPGLTASIETFLRDPTDASLENMVSNLDATVGYYADTGSNKGELLQKLVAWVQVYKDDPNGTNRDVLLAALTAYINGYDDSAAATEKDQLLMGLVGQVSDYMDSPYGTNKADLLSSLDAAIALYSDTDSNKAQLLQDLKAKVLEYGNDPNADPDSLVSALIATIVEATLGPNYTAPTVPVKGQIGLSGYDMSTYQTWLQTHPVNVTGIVRLGTLDEGALDDPNTVVRYWGANGIEIPCTPAVKAMLTDEDFVVYDEDGTLHVFLTAEVAKITGTKEAVEEAREAIEEEGSGISMTEFGTAALGLPSYSEMDQINGYLTRIRENFDALKNGQNWWDSMWNPNGRKDTLSFALESDFSPEKLSELSIYVGELVAAIQQGSEISDEDYANLERITDLVGYLEELDVGGNVVQAVNQGLTGAEWSTPADTVGGALKLALESATVGAGENVGGAVTEGMDVGMENHDFSGAAGTAAENLDSALRDAEQSNSPAQRTVPIGEDVAAGIGLGMTQYSFGGAAGTVSSHAQSAVSRALNRATLRGVGYNAMSGLALGIQQGQSLVTDAIRSAAIAAVEEAKRAFVIKSPSRVFRDEIGAMVMRGFGEGIAEETANQAKIISNAARFLTAEAREAAIGYTAPANNGRVYNNESSVNLTGNNFYIRDEQDVHSLAVEIATLTKRQQHGKGLRFA